jgi:hypothetical protein
LLIYVFQRVKKFFIARLGVSTELKITAPPKKKKKLQKRKKKKLIEQ